MHFVQKQRVKIYVHFLRVSENPSHDTQFLFKFSCRGNQVDWVKNKRGDDSRGEHARTRRIPDLELPVLIDRHQLKQFEETREFLDAILVELPVSERDRDELIRGVLKKAVDLPIEFRWMGIGIGGVRAAVVVSRERTYYGSRQDYDRLGGEDEHHVFMTPTGEYVMECAKKRKRSVLSEPEICSICLENLPERSEVVSMPCNHVFHGDCIRKWLEVSHYCPLCRFEMQTARKMVYGSNPF